MKEAVEWFSKLMIENRDWTWSVIGICQILLTLILRNWCLSPLVNRSKQLKHSWYQTIKGFYLGRCVWGWFAYLLSFGIVILIWSRPDVLPLTPLYGGGLLLAVALYLLSILLHLQAFGVAMAMTLKRLESERE